MKALPRGPRLSVFCLWWMMVAVVMTAGCTRRAEQEAEKRVNAVLPRYIGPAKKWDTKVKGENFGAILRGRLKSVHVVGTKVQVAPDLVLDQLVLDFEEVSVDTKAQRLESVGRATFSGSVRDFALTRYLRAQRPGLKGLLISFEGNELVVHAEPDALGVLRVPTDVRGRLVPRGGPYMDFEPTGAKVSILPIPQMALDYLARKLNPAVDLSHLVAPLQLQQANVRGSYLHLAGSIDPDDILKLNSSR